MVVLLVFSASEEDEPLQPEDTYNQTKKKGDWTDFGACVWLYSVRTQRLHVRLASSCVSAHPALEVVMSLLFPLIIYDSGHY